MIQINTSENYMDNDHRHAYLIMAHKNWDQVGLLLSLLDDPRNDFYLHIDKNVHLDPVILEHLKKECRLSNLYMVDPVRVVWGGYSMVKAELCLLKASVPRGYRYYHLLSGQDLPLRPTNDIYAFFEEHDSFEFIWFGDNEWINSVRPRCRYFWLLQERIGRDERPFLHFLEKVNIKAQKLIHLDRLKQHVFSAGANWFSITNELAEYVLSQEKQIHKRFRFTQCADECFLECLVMESKFREKCWTPDSSKQTSMLRMVDFNRGNPYVYRMDDFEELMQSGNLFARKFDMDVDADIISAIKDKVCTDARRSE